jgi:hypothetical protein
MSGFYTRDRVPGEISIAASVGMHDSGGAYRRLKRDSEFRKGNMDRAQ